LLRLFPPTLVRFVHGRPCAALRLFAADATRASKFPSAIECYMNTLSQFLEALLGLGMEPKELTFLQISLRGVIVFATTLVMVRLSSKRSLSENTAFDAVLIVIIASVLARAINGSAPFFPSLVVGFVLVVSHRALGEIAYFSHGFGILIKGKMEVLVQNGKLQHKTMHLNQISKH